MNQFEKDYFVNSVISNYIDYRKKKFDKQSIELIKILNLKETDSIIDFGCATGGLIKSLKDKGIINIKGTDISYWAIEYGKSKLNLNKELYFYNTELLYYNIDYIFMFDVLEHLSDNELQNVLTLSNKGLKKQLLIRIPVSLNEGEDYFLEISRNDKTHIQIHCKKWWIELLSHFNFTLKEEINTKTMYCSPGVFSGIFYKGEL